MKKIKLFLASSFSGIEKDRIELGAFVDSLNERYEQHNVYFQLIVDGDDIKGGLKNAAEESDLFYIVFHREAPENAIEEFNAAYERFVRSGEQKKPKITTYFKKVEDGEPGKNVIDFMERLDKELGHYYNNYTHIDTLKLNISLQLESLGLDEMKVKLKDGRICLDDIPLDITLDNIPMVFNNRRLADLKNELEEVIAECSKLRELTRHDPDDDDALDAYNQARTRRKEIGSEIHNLQKDILDTVSRFLKSVSSGYVTPRMKAAMKCLEDGDIEGALQELDAEEMKLENELLLEESDILEMKAQAQIDEWLARVQALKLDTSNQNRFAEIEQAYEQAIMLEQRFKLPRKALLEYSEYLSKRNQNTRAVNYAEEYLRYLSRNEAEDAEYLYVNSILTQLYEKLLKYDEAEKMYKQREGILKRLMGDNHDEYFWDLTHTLISLAEISDKLGRDIDAQEYYKENLKISVSHALKNPEKANIHFPFQYLISFLKKKGYYDQAEEYYRHQIEIYEQLTEKAPRVHKGGYADACVKLAEFLEGLDDEEKKREADTLYNKGLTLLTQFLSDDNSEKYEGYPDSLADYRYMRIKEDLADRYTKLADLLNARGEYSQAERYHRKRLDIALQLAEEKSDVANRGGGFLLWSFGYLLHFLRERESFNEIEEVLKQQLETYRQLVKKSPSDFRLYARAYTELAKFLEERNRQKEADEFYIQGLYTLKKFAEENTEVRVGDLAENYTQFAKSLAKRGEHIDAEECHRQRLDIALKGGADLGWSFGYLIDFLKDSGQDGKLEEVLRQQLEVYEQLAEKDPSYGSGCADACAELAAFLNEKNQNYEADELYERGQAILLQLANEEPERSYLVSLGEHYTKRAESLAKRGEFIDAAKYHRERLNIALKIVKESPKQADLSWSFKYLKDYLRESGQDETLGEVLRQQLEVYGQLAEKDTSYGSKCVDAYTELAEFLAYTGKKYDDAEELYRKAIKLLLKEVDTDSYMRHKFNTCCKALYEFLAKIDKVVELNEPTVESIMELLGITLPNDIADLQGIEYP